MDAGPACRGLVSFYLGLLSPGDRVTVPVYGLGVEFRLHCTVYTQMIHKRILLLGQTCSEHVHSYYRNSCEQFFKQPGHAPPKKFPRFSLLLEEVGRYNRIQANKAYGDEWRKIDCMELLTGKAHGGMPNLEIRLIKYYSFLQMLGFELGTCRKLLLEGFS